MSNAQQNLNNNAKHQFGDGKEMTFTQKIDFIKTQEKMVTPKEKADELIDKYLNASFNCKGCDKHYCYITCTRLCLMEAKECALIAVNEIINSIPTQPSNSKMERLDAITFWMLVKEEIKTYGGNK